MLTAQREDFILDSPTINIPVTFLLKILLENLSLNDGYLMRQNFTVSLNLLAISIWQRNHKDMNMIIITFYCQTFEQSLKVPTFLIGFVLYTRRYHKISAPSLYIYIQNVSSRLFMYIVPDKKIIRLNFMMKIQNQSHANLPTKTCFSFSSTCFKLPTKKKKSYCGSSKFSRDVSG